MQRPPRLGRRMRWLARIGLHSTLALLLGLALAWRLGEQRFFANASNWSAALGGPWSGLFPAGLPPSAVELQAIIPLLLPLHEPIRKPGPPDWLANYKEPGQTFARYVSCGPVQLTPDRRVIYVQPVGDFSTAQRKIVEETAAFMAVYFSTEMKLCDSLPLSLVPEHKRRAARGFGVQIQTGAVLDGVLAPRLPPDAAAFVAITSADLYPDDKWNFVFGQAHLRNRTGVWSLARYGNPETSEDARKLCLLRMMKVSTHETGHMFTIYHCITNQCNMNGSNHLAESDAKPLWLCPECEAKVCWATGAHPVAHLRALAEFCDERGFEAESTFFEKSAKKLGLVSEEPD
jgi:archaemetzincin